jgi:hypothetical protein
MSGVVNGNYLLDVGEGEPYHLHVDPATLHHVYITTPDMLNMNCVPSIAPKYELEIKSTTPILIGSVFMILLVLFLIVTDTLNSPLDCCNFL